MANQKVRLYRLKLIGYVEGWFMGHDYMRGVSHRTAKALSEALPDIGMEVCVAKLEDGSFWHRLMLQNISGTFVLACSSAKVETWDRHFNLDIVHYEG